MAPAVKPKLTAGSSREPTPDLVLFWSKGWRDYSCFQKTIDQCAAQKKCYSCYINYCNDTEKTLYVDPPDLPTVAALSRACRSQVGINESDVIREICHDQFHQELELNSQSSSLDLFGPQFN